MYRCLPKTGQRCLRASSHQQNIARRTIRRSFPTPCVASLSTTSNLPGTPWPVAITAWCAVRWHCTSRLVSQTLLKHLPPLPNLSPDRLNNNLQGMFRQMRMLAMVAPFATLDPSGGTQIAVNVWLPFWQALFGFSNFYLFILFMRVLLSWFPALDWSRNPWLVIKVITDPYLNVFRNLIPALFMAIDLTPLLGFMLLQDFVAILENCVIENLFSDTVDEPTSDPFIYLEQDFSRFTQR